MNAVPFYEHQKKTLALYRAQPCVFDCSDPGTGKTRVTLEAFAERRANGGGQMFLVAPNSLLMSAWGDDLEKFTPRLRIKYALAGKREQAFENNPDIVAINTDGVRWFFERKGRTTVPTKEGLRLLKGFDTCAVDESADYKHHASQRSKAMLHLSRLFEFKAMLTGTAAPNSVTELWHQVMLLDGGASLGDSFYRFRDQTQTPHAVSMMKPGVVKWTDKPGIRMLVAPLIQHLVVAHKFEECTDIPAHSVRRVTYRMPPRLAKRYAELEATAVLRLAQGALTAVNAAVLRNKLLQVASGAVYANVDRADHRASHGFGDDGGYVLLDGKRYELVAELVREDPEPSLVFYSWKHQQVEIEKALAKAGVRWATMESKLGPARRKQLVDRYQNGDFDTLLLHPATGAHGLTLTRGRRTIVVSPFDRADWLKQAKHRVWRAGQRHKTETILVEAERTVERKVYGSLDGKTASMEQLFELFEEN